MKLVLIVTSVISIVIVGLSMLQIASDGMAGNGATLFLAGYWMFQSIVGLMAADKMAR